MPSLHCRSSVCSTCPSDCVWFMSLLLSAVNPPGEPFNQAHIMQTPPDELLILPCGVPVWLLARFERRPSCPVRSEAVAPCDSFQCSHYTFFSIYLSVVSFSLPVSIFVLYFCRSGTSPTHAVLFSNSGVSHLAITRSPHRCSRVHSQWLTCSLGDRFSSSVQLHTAASQMDCALPFIPPILAHPPPHLLPRSILTSLPLWKMTPAEMPVW